MNRRRKFLIASIVAVQDTSFIYPSCQKCFSRVILVSKRFECPKCCYTGEAKNVTYRYKLSLKVSDANRLFTITVFGSCLDTFFGITATCLNRYIKDSNQIERTLDSSEIQDLLIQAVQACFVGKTFIFGVTNFENQGEQASTSNNSLQKSSHNNGHVKDLVACQISLPNSDVTGYTVINYFDQLLQSANFKNIHCGSQLPDSHVLEGDQPSIELSSLGSSSSRSCFVQSSGRDRLSRLWQQFLGLSPVITQPDDDEDLSMSDQSEACGVLPQQREKASSAKDTHFNNCLEPIGDLRSPHLSLGEETQREKLGMESGFPTSHLTAVLNNYHETRGANNWSSFHPLKLKQSLEESNTNHFPSTPETEKKCPHPNVTHLQAHSLGLSSSLQRKISFSNYEAGAGDTPEGQPEIWDDLPFSESLNAFLEVIENENTTALEGGQDVSPLDGQCSRLFTNPQKVPHMKPQIKHKNCGSSSSLLSSYDSKKISSSLDNTASCFSINIHGEKNSDCAIPDVNVSVQSQAPKYPSFKKRNNVLQYKGELISSPHTSGNTHSCANTKYSMKCRERGSSEMDRTATSLCSEKHVFSGTSPPGNKGCSIWPQNPEGMFTTFRELVQNSNTHGNNKNVSTHVFASMAESQVLTSTTVNKNFLQNYSPGHDGSYDASADLFDVSAKEMETVAKSEGILSPWGNVLTESHPVSNFPLKLLDDNCSHFRRRSSSQNTLKCVRTHSSPYFQTDSDYDLGDSQDFVPYSQSTPVVPLHCNLRVPRMKESFQKYPKLYTNLHTNYKKSTLSFDDGIQQPIPDCLNEKTTNLRFSKTSIARGSQQMLINSSPTIKFLETNFDDLVLPTTKKVFLSPVLPTSEMHELSSRGPGKWPAACSTPNQTEEPKNKKRKIKQRTDEDFIGKEFHLKNKYRMTTMKQITPELEKSKDIELCSPKNVILRTDSHSNVKCRLSFSENESLPAAEVPSSWSPELFTHS